MGLQRVMSSNEKCSAVFIFQGSRYYPFIWQLITWKSASVSRSRKLCIISKELLAVCESPSLLKYLFVPFLRLRFDGDQWRPMLHLPLSWRHHPLSASMQSTHLKTPMDSEPWVSLCRRAGKGNLYVIYLFLCSPWTSSLPSFLFYFPLDTLLPSTSHLLHIVVLSVE